MSLIFLIQSVPTEYCRWQTVYPYWRNRRKQDTFRTWDTTYTNQDRYDVQAAVKISDDWKYPVNQDGLWVHLKLTLCGKCLCCLFHLLINNSHLIEWITQAPYTFFQWTSTSLIAVASKLLFLARQWLVLIECIVKIRKTFLGQVGWLWFTGMWSSHCTHSVYPEAGRHHKQLHAA